MTYALVFVASLLFETVIVTPCYCQGLQAIASVPYTTVDNVDLNETNAGVPIISAMVNGYPVKLMLDTGTTANIISDDLANRAGMTVAGGTETMLDAGGKRENARIFEQVAIQVGVLTIKGDVLSVKDYSFTGIGHSRIDGIIGKVSFNNIAILISPSLKTVTFYAPGRLSQQQREEIGMGSAAALPIKLNSNNLLSVSVAFKQKSTVVSEDLVVDTGAGRTTVSESAFKALKGKVISRHTSIFGFSNGVATTFSVEQMSLGSIDISDPIVDYIEHDKSKLPRSLGRDVLSQYQVLIDTPAMTMYLLPATVPIPPQKDGTMLPPDTSQTDTTKEQPK